MFLFTSLCFLSEGLFGQHNMKKRKMMRQSLDNSFDNLTPMAGSIPSPVASQMSNMPNPNKLIKILAVRDRGRKSKSFKVLRRLTLILHYSLSCCSSFVSIYLEFSGFHGSFVDASWTARVRKSMVAI